jgi:hypothetical protein
MPSPRRLPSPWTVEEQPACFVVGLSFTTIAVDVAKLPELLRGANERTVSGSLTQRA